MAEFRLMGGKDTGPREISAGAADAEERRQHGLRVIEALLFAAKDPLDEAALQRHLPKTPPVADLIEELQRHYRFRGVNLVRVANGFAFRTSPDLAAELSGAQVEMRRLSRAQTETLAIIAYHQPVTRAEVEEIRGVTLHKGTLDLLMEAGWIMPKGRRETPGRPVTWVTTDAFLSHFGLGSIGDLPQLEELRAAGLLDSRPVAVMGESEGREDREDESGGMQDEGL